MRDLPLHPASCGAISRRTSLYVSEWQFDGGAADFLAVLLRLSRHLDHDRAGGSRHVCCPDRDNEPHDLSGAQGGSPPGQITIQVLGYRARRADWAWQGRVRPHQCRVIRGCKITQLGGSGKGRVTTSGRRRRVRCRLRPGRDAQAVRRNARDRPDRNSPSISPPATE
jgi:hypothetical protein